MLTSTPGPADQKLRSRSTRHLAVLRNRPTVSTLVQRTPLSFSVSSRSRRTAVPWTRRQSNHHRNQVACDGFRLPVKWSAVSARLMIASLSMSFVKRKPLCRGDMVENHSNATQRINWQRSVSDNGLVRLGSCCTSNLRKVVQLGPCRAKVFGFYFFAAARLDSIRSRFAIYHPIWDYLRRFVRSPSL